MARHPGIVLTVNVLPFAVYLVLLARLIEGYGKTDFGKLLAFAAAARHVPDDVLGHAEQPHPGGVLHAVRGLPAAEGDAREPRRDARAATSCCGFFAGFAATFDLPARGVPRRSVCRS